MAIAKRKKRFFDVNIPIIGKTTNLLAFELEELEDRIVTYDLTRLLRGKSAIINTKVKIENEEAIAIPTQMKLMSYYIKRLVRKGTNYVEDSFSTDCKDAQIRLKPFLVTRRKVSRKVRKALREEMKKELITYVKNKTANDIFDDLIKNRIQKPISLKLKKIYPLSVCEIRIIKIEKMLEVPTEKKVETKKTEEKVEEVKETAEEIIEKIKEEKAIKAKEVKDKE